MAVITLSPLVSDARGKTANIVFSAWKGRNYIRELVKPANPQTEDQMAQRARMAKAIDWWHSLESAIKLYCKELAAQYAISGANAFTSRNVKDMYDELPERIIPLNSPHAPVTELEGTDIDGSGKSTLTWSKPSPLVHTKFRLLCQETGDGPPAANLEVINDLDTDIEDEEFEITLPRTGKTFDVYLLSRADDDSEFSPAARVSLALAT